MKNSFLEKFGIEKLFIFIIVIAAVAVFVFVFYLFVGYSSRTIELSQPMGKEEWEIGQTYEIKWSSKGVERVGIVLFNGENPEWIAENVSALKGSYEWRIQPGHDYGPNFWIAVFEYPWKSGNEVSYTRGSFSVTYPELASCDSLSTQEEWPFLASDAPNVRKVLITKEEFKGDLGGLDGANEKCKTAAAELGYEGNWTAFIGGEAPENTAIKRLERTPNALNGVFVEADVASTLLRGATCHRILGRNFNEFLGKFSDLVVVNKDKLSESFLKNMSKIWLGRVNDESKRSCLPVKSSFSYSNIDLVEKYSYTVSCQDWTYEDKTVVGYNRSTVLDDTFPFCYTPSGEFTYSVGVGGLSSGLEGEDQDAQYVIDAGKYCSKKQYLMCIED